MGLTGFNLARRKQEEAASAAPSSRASAPEATAVEDKPKRKRRGHRPSAPVDEVIVSPQATEPEVAEE